jgi:NSS family neurotransmitter:Na+ symporter
LFFLLLSFAALTSAIALLEVPVTYLVDEHKFSRKKAVVKMTTFIFILGLPSLFGNGYSEFFTKFIQYGSLETPTNFLTFLIHTNDIIQITGGILIAVFAAYVWKKSNWSDEISTGFPNFKDSRTQVALGILLGYICPIVLTVLLILTVLDRYFGIILI